MASNLTRDKPEISSPASKKSKTESDPVDTPLSGQSNPTPADPVIAEENSPLTLAKLFKEEEPFYSDLLDQISKDPAYIRWERLLKRHYLAISRDNPPEFDVEGCLSAVKQFLDNPQLVAKVQFFWDGVEKLYEMVTGVKINAKDELGRTALHSACAKGKLKKAKFLIDNDIDIGITDNKGNTALHFAAAHGNELCVKLMLESGADATHTNSYGDTAYGIAELNDETGVMDLIKKLVEKEPDKFQLPTTSG